MANFEERVLFPILFGGVGRLTRDKGSLKLGVGIDTKGAEEKS